MGFQGALRSGIATHSLGNQIEQVLSNQPITFNKCKETTFPTDYLVISATISIKLSINS